MRKRSFLIAAFLAAVFSPAGVLACAVCYNAQPSSRNAYIGVTLFMIVLPFLLLGGIWHVLRR